MKRLNLRLLAILGMSFFLILVAYFNRGAVAQSSIPTPVQVTHFSAADNRRPTKPAISPDGSQVAYIIDTVPGEGALSIVNTDGNSVPSVYFLRLDRSKEVRWGGSEVVFVACDGCPPFLNADVYVVNSDGTQPSRLSTGGHINSSPTISADGSTVLYSQSNQLFLAKTDGSSTTVLTNLTGLVAGSTPLPNADSSKVLFLWYNGITFKLKVANVPTGLPSEVVDVGSLGQPFSFTWSSDGTAVVYTRNSGVSILNPDGTGLLVLEPEGQIRTSGSPSLPADASIVVYERSSGGGGTSVDVYSINPDATNKRNLSNTPTGCIAGSFPCRSSNPTVSQNGSMVAFLSDADLDAGKNPDHVTQVFVVPTGASPTLSVTPSSGQQLTTTFTFSGSDFTIDGAMQRWITLPNGTTEQLGDINADSSGQVSWVFTPQCTNPVGDYTVWCVDVSTGRLSNQVTETITRNSSCPLQTPTGFYYPVNQLLTSDGNWLACGQDYYTNVRHIGTDIAEAVGTPVYAIADGTVVAVSGPGECSGWGFTNDDGTFTGNYGLEILHQTTAGPVVALYGHIQPLLLGGSVRAGQQIGTCGSYWGHKKSDYVKCIFSGQMVLISISHLHFGIHPGSAAIPRPLGRIADKGCKDQTATNGFIAPISFINTASPQP